MNVATQLSAAPFCPGPRPSLGLSIDSLTCGFKGFFLVFCYPDYVFYFAPFYGNLEDIHPVFILPAIIFQFLTIHWALDLNEVPLPHPSPLGHHRAAS